MKTARVQIARWGTFVGSLVVVAAAGVFTVGQSPHLNRGSDSLLQDLGLSNPTSQSQEIQSATTRITPQCLPPESFDGPPGEIVAANNADLDNLIVQVAPNGTLDVCGEVMPVEQFRELLEDPAIDQLSILITIRPHKDCVFRHVSPIITLCEEHGIPHNTVPARTSTLPGVISAGL